MDAHVLAPGVPSNTAERCGLLRHTTGRVARMRLPGKCTGGGDGPSARMCWVATNTWQGVGFNPAAAELTRLEGTGW